MGTQSRIPTPEDEPVRPISPYAIDQGGGGARVLDARRRRRRRAALNHEGPGRDERFAVGSWTRQIARLEAEGGGTLRVGDLSAERDISDVRDVCRAYRLLLDRSVPAGTYNVASGRERHDGARGGAAGRSSRACRYRSSATRAECGRPTSRELCGDPSRCARRPAGSPEIPLEQTLADALGAARELEPAR